MRFFKLTGSLIAILALSAVAVVTTASAEETLWKWLPGSVGETMTGKSGKALLRTKFGAVTLVVECAKSLILLEKSELLKEGATNEKDATLALLIDHFEGCKSSLGPAANSTGDSSGIILVHIEVHNCMIKTGDFGVLLKPLPLDIEVPTAKALVLVSGDVLGLLEGKEGTKQLTFLLNLKRNANGEQEFLKCEGGEKEELKAMLGTGEAVPATEEVEKGELTFDMTKDVNGEEMMEK